MDQESMTPSELAENLGVTAATVRGWLRRHGAVKTGGQWLIDPATAAAAIAHYTGAEALPRICSVEGCGRARMSRSGLCRLHWQRWTRNGQLQARDGAEHQRAKTHCPQGHEYTPENTYVFSDGRRRCRRCRLDAANQRHDAGGRP